MRPLVIADHPSRALVLALADRLAHPDLLPAHDASPSWQPQSLANGVPGIALLHIELAALEIRPWHRVHDWLNVLAESRVETGSRSSLFHGAPALAHALSCATSIRRGSYERLLSDLDIAIATEVRQRVDAAHRRMDGGKLTVPAEYDLIRGLTGLGRYLLHRDPQGDAVRHVLTYLVRLTEPVLTDPVLPGWYTSIGPSGRSDDLTPGGHVNHGLAHGIAGPLSLLALAAARGVTVGGQHEAAERICTWLEQWQAETNDGPLWPYWLSRDELDQQRSRIATPQRPSWCYGIAGQARSLQLAANVCGDDTRRLIAETAMIRALSHPASIAVTAGISLCHGKAGLALCAARAGVDALPCTADQLRSTLIVVLDAIHDGQENPNSVADVLVRRPQAGAGLLDGAAGTALALSACTISPPQGGWDRCLLIA